MYRIGMNEVPSYVSEGHIERRHEETASREIAIKQNNIECINASRMIKKQIVLKKIQ